MSTALEPAQRQRIEPKRDKRDKYRAPLEDGRERSWIRATTITKTFEDQSAITTWKLRQLAYGMARNKGLLTSAQAHHPDHDKQVYNDIVGKALDTAETDEAATIGTALHRMTEDYDLGIRSLDQMPAQWRPYVELYAQAVAEAGWTEVDRHVEEVVLHDGYQIAGTADRIVRDQHGNLAIADLKTSKTMSYGFMAHGMQLALYANHTATAHYTYREGYVPVGVKEADNENKIATRHDRIEGVNRDYGYIIHLPWQGDEAGTCTIYQVDITEAWAAVICAMEARGYRTAGRKWGSSIVSIGNPVEQDRMWIRQRLQLALSSSPKAFQLAMNIWPAHIPTTGLNIYEFSPQEIDQLSGLCDTIEAQYELPFGQTRPRDAYQPTGIHTGNSKGNDNAN